MLPWYGRGNWFDSSSQHQNNSTLNGAQMYSKLTLIDRLDKAVSLAEQLRQLVTQWGDDLEKAQLKRYDHEQRLHQEIPHRH